MGFGQTSDSQGAQGSTYIAKWSENNSKTAGFSTIVKYNENSFLAELIMPVMKQMQTQGFFL